jgi:hypothetical protein
LKFISKSVMALALAAALAPAALAQADAGNLRVYREGNSWVQETTGTLASTVRYLKIKTSGGSIHVNGGSQGNVTYTVKKRVRTGSEEQARRYFTMMRVSAGASGDSGVFVADFENFNHGSTDFILVTPRNIELVNASTGGGDLQAAHLSGAVKAESGGGNLDMDDLGGFSGTTGGGNVSIGTITRDARFSTGGGNVNVRSVGGYLSVETGGGNVDVDTAKQDAKIETGGGKIRVAHVGGNLRAETGGDAIEIGDVGGTATLETGGGNIQVTGGNGFVKADTGGGNVQCYNLVKGVHATTGAGRIIAELRKGQFAASRLETGAGDIVVYIPSDMAVSIRASIDAAMSKSAIDSQFNAIKIMSEGGQLGPREMYAEGDLNGGGPILKIHTSTGKIQLLQAKK